MDALLFLALMSVPVLALVTLESEPRDPFPESSPRSDGVPTMWQFHAHTTLDLVNERGRALREEARLERLMRPSDSLRPTSDSHVRQVRAAVAAPLRAVARLTGGASAMATVVASRIEGQMA